MIALLRFWDTKTWHTKVLRHTITYKKMPLPELFDSECSCGTWWFR